MQSEMAVKKIGFGFGSIRCVYLAALFTAVQPRESFAISWRVVQMVVFSTSIGITCNAKTAEMGINYLKLANASQIGIGIYNIYECSQVYRIQMKQNVGKEWYHID
ncbi:hypothetical protein EGR_08236 [Echinococcus granulosus]|uniref:Uncharacterized protein n=1 Tax=Echinococcus granulosus TaxID=6210 RepID=W6UU18_ECHGR|nr:hypothetical protein EGR_08236 [Echinococcus granulosus]EUB56884.1 hypothetical protein EGR_08236 [Echinococcus granulosus]